MSSKKSLAVWAAGTLMAVAVVVAGVLLAQAYSDEHDYGPGVAILNAWAAAPTRGDLADDNQLLAAIGARAQRAVESKTSELNGPAHVAFAQSTPDGRAVAYVVQYATDTSYGETSAAQGVSLPVGVGVWLDETMHIQEVKVVRPVSQAESATTPNDGEVVVGMWNNQDSKYLVLFDSGYPTMLRTGYLTAEFSSATDLLRREPKEPVDFGDAGLVVTTPGSRIIPDTAAVWIDQPKPLDNVPLLLGGSFDLIWSYPRTLEDERGDVDPSAMGFESVSGSRDPTIGGWPVAYRHGVTRRVNRWVGERLSFPLLFFSTPMQAHLPTGVNIFFRNLLPGKAYVALVEYPNGKVVARRCRVAGPALTAVCQLPSGLGRVIVTDVPFEYQDHNGEWKAGVEDRSYSALAPRRGGVRLHLEDGDTVPLTFVVCSGLDRSTPC